MTCPVEDAQRRARRLQLISALRATEATISERVRQLLELATDLVRERGKLKRELEELEREESTT